MYSKFELEEKLLPELKQIAKEVGVKKVDSYKKSDLIYEILDVQAKIKPSEQPAPQPEKKAKRTRVKDAQKIDMAAMNAAETATEQKRVERPRKADAAQAAASDDVIVVEPKAQPVADKNERQQRGRRNNFRDDKKR